MEDLRLLLVLLGKWMPPFAVNARHVLAACVIGMPRQPIMLLEPPRRRRLHIETAAGIQVATVDVKPTWTISELYTHAAAQANCGGILLLTLVEGPEKMMRNARLFTLGPSMRLTAENNKTVESFWPAKTAATAICMVGDVRESPELVFQGTHSRHLTFRPIEVRRLTSSLVTAMFRTCFGNLTRSLKLTSEVYILREDARKLGIETCMSYKDPRCPIPHRLFRDTDNMANPLSICNAIQALQDNPVITRTEFVSILNDPHDRIWLRDCLVKERPPVFFDKDANVVDVPRHMLRVEKYRQRENK